MRQQTAAAETTADRYWRMGTECIARWKGAGQNSARAIKPDDPEWPVWESYFRSIGWRPAVMRMVEAGSVPSMTVPCQWPEWLDDRISREAAE